MKTRVFRFVEGEAFGYRTTIRNTGDEPIRSEELPKLELRWRCANGQETSWDLTLPTEIPPEGSHSYEWFHHEVLAAGVVNLHLRVHSATGSPVDVEVRNTRGEVVPIEPAGFIRGTKTHAVSTSAFALESFRALSRMDVNQQVLIAIAVIALVVNAMFAYLNYAK